MPRPRNRLVAAAIAVLAALTGCDAAPNPKANAALPKLGLLTGLPLIHPLGADVAAIASGSAPVPWQREALARDYALTPLDTLAPVPASSPAAPASDPLKGLTRLAVIQPRALSPQDNVALDDWVRAGGHLLLVLDPLLTGDYELPLTDPRHPPASALIPPVVRRWGMAVSFDASQDPAVREGALAGAPLPLALAGRIAIIDPAAAACTLTAGGAAATCRVAKGRVTLIADAAVFEHRELAGSEDATLRAVARAALD